MLKPSASCTVRAAFCSLLIGLMALPALGRQWTDSTGQFKIDAELVAYDGKVAKLKLTNGGSFDIPLAKLSAEDVAYLKKTYPDGLAGEAMKAKEGKVAGMKAEVVSLAIVKPSPVLAGDERGTGTHLRITITDPARTVVGLDAKASKIAFCKDDKGKDLTGGSAASGEQLALVVASDGKSGIVDLHQPEVPGEKATKIRLKGELHVVCGGLGGEAETVKLPLAIEVGLGL